MDKAAVVPLPITGGVNDDRTAALQQWASTVGFGGEVGRLVEAHRRLDSVLAETQGKEIRNKELQRRLREASHDAARARDLLGELEYYRIREEVERDDHDKVSAGFVFWIFFYSPEVLVVLFPNPLMYLYYKSKANYCIFQPSQSH
jgi:dephospho-CoA kinase